MPGLPIGTDRGQGAGKESADAVLRFAANYVAATEALDELLAFDPRDLDRTPGPCRARRSADGGAGPVVRDPDHDMAELLAKARVIVLRAERVGVDADPLALGLATYLLAFGAG